MDAIYLCVVVVAAAADAAPISPDTHTRQVRTNNDAVAIVISRTHISSI